MIYLDNAATTLMKPDGVLRAMADCMRHYAANPGRGGHQLSLFAGEQVYRCREQLAALFGIDTPEQIAFTSNTTMALNFAIKGLVSAGDHVVIGGMEHNSVLRPVVHSGASYSVAAADATGLVTAQAVAAALKPDTKLIIINHASNVVGTISPIGQIGALAKARGIPLLVDAAQSAGVVEIDVKRDGISMLAFAGHKLLYGPPGTGGLYVHPSIRLRSLVEGGTGTLSEQQTQPDFMPDQMESGTLNTVGIVGLLAGVSYVRNQTVARIHAYENKLTTRLMEGLGNVPGVTLLGGANRVGVVGFLMEGLDSVTVCGKLDEQFHIAARGGMHCAIQAHRSLGTEKTGVARLSVSSFTQPADVEHAIVAVNRIARRK